MVLSNGGLQVPVIPLFERVGKGDNTLPEQIGATDVKVGVGFGIIVIVSN